MMIIIITVIIIKGTWQRVLREKLLEDNLNINLNTIVSIQCKNEYGARLPFLFSVERVCV